jgi:CRP-like cAMP-binding protein
MPLITRRSSTRALPRVSVGRCGLIFENCAFVRRLPILTIHSRAHGRIAHLICEVYLRLKATGLTNGYTLQIPVTQSEIAEATGLSNVHVNRSIQRLRAEGLITLAKTHCTIENWEALIEAGTFDPSYLHQRV